SDSTSKGGTPRSEETTPPSPSSGAADATAASEAPQRRAPFQRPLESGLDQGVYKCYMLGSMTPELQRQYEKMDARSILLHVRKLFEEQRRTQRYKISKSLFRARMIEGTPVQNHVLKMIEWIEKLTGLGMVIEDNLAILYLEGNMETKVFSDPITGLVRRIREVAIRADDISLSFIFCF
ncbi:unnamed protein product, partial [Musa hybrid cultivar]